MLSGVEDLGSVQVNLNLSVVWPERLSRRVPIETLLIQFLSLSKMPDAPDGSAHLMIRLHLGPEAVVLNRSHRPTHLGFGRDVGQHSPSRLRPEVIGPNEWTLGLNTVDVTKFLLEALVLAQH